MHDKYWDSPYWTSVFEANLEYILEERWALRAFKSGMSKEEVIEWAWEKRFVDWCIEQQEEKADGCLEE